MAGVLAHVNSGEVSLAASTAKTVLQIEAANHHRVLLRGLSIMGKGTGTTDTPIRARLLRQTSAGTMTTATAEKNDESDDETIQATSRINATAEPTAGNPIQFWEFHPQTGLMVFFPPGLEPVIKGGNRLGLELLAAQAQTVAVSALFEE